MADLAAAPSLFEHFYLWLNRHAPQYLDALRRSRRASTTKEALEYYCRTGDEGAWLLGDYYQATGRALPTDTLALLRQWFAVLRLSRLERDPAAGWRPVHPAQLMGLLPDDHIKGVEELAHALRPVLVGIYSGGFDFDGGRFRVRVEVRDHPRRRPTFDLVKGRVEEALAQGRISWEDFVGMTEEAMRARFHPESSTARNIVRAVREALRKQDKS